MTIYSCQFVGIVQSMKRQIMLFDFKGGLQWNDPPNVGFFQCLIDEIQRLWGCKDGVDIWRGGGGHGARIGRSIGGGRYPSRAATFKTGQLAGNICVVGD